RGISPPADGRADRIRSDGTEGLRTSDRDEASSRSCPLNVPTAVHERPRSAFPCSASGGWPGEAVAKSFYGRDWTFQVPRARTRVLSYSSGRRGPAAQEIGHL